MKISKRNSMTAVTLITSMIYSLPMLASSTRSQSVGVGVCETCIQGSQNKALQNFLLVAQNICESATTAGERERCRNRDNNTSREKAIFLDYDENDNPYDPRVRMDDPQLNAIGLVEVSGFFDGVPPSVPDTIAARIRAGDQILGKGTGFMINKCLVVTNYHVAMLNDGGGRFREGTHEVFFTPGAAEFGIQEKNRVRGQVVASVGGAYSNSGNRFADWAVVKLDQSYGPEIRPLAVNYTEDILKAEHTEQLHIAALYTDLEDGRVLYGQKNCVGDGSIVSKTYGRDHLCANMPGTSGAPIMIKKNGRYEVIGINSMQRTSGFIEQYTGNKANGYIDLQTALPKEKLDQIIAANPCP